MSVYFTFVVPQKFEAEAEILDPFIEYSKHKYVEFSRTESFSILQYIASWSSRRVIGFLIRSLKLNRA